jgi:uncharacterized protein Yka (UPF0111/DUF47 family)
MSEETEAQRIKRLQELCNHLDTLRQQADEICKEVTAEIRRSRIKPDRRSKRAKVKRDRRRRRRPRMP